MLFPISLWSVPPLPTVPAGIARSQRQPPSSVHTPVVWELLMFVGVSVSAVEQVLLSPSHGQVCAALLSCCSESRTWGREGGDPTYWGGN